jgi:hypothetical protein
LGIAIRKNKHIRCITIGGIEHKLSQYADDATLFLDDDEKSLKHVMKVLLWYHITAGLKNNNTKTKLVWIDSTRESDRRFCRVSKAYTNNNEDRFLGK